MLSFAAELFIVTTRESGNTDGINGSDGTGPQAGFEPPISPAHQHLALSLLSYTFHSPLKQTNYFSVQGFPVC